MVYTVGSLFSGIGGIDLAFSLAGFDIRWQVEIDPFCRAVLQKHAPQYWPNVKQYEDVKHVSKANLESVDVIFGGFPCQDVSTAGKRQGIKEGNRSGLWLEFARIIGELRPQLVLLENVRGILSKDGIRVLSDLTQMGYDTEWGVLAASDLGAPHQRERWFCVAYTRCQRYSRQGFATENNLNQEQIDSLPEQRCNEQSQAVGNGEVLEQQLAHPKGAGLSQSRSSRFAAHETKTSSGMDNRSERCGDSPAVEIANITGSSSECDPQPNQEQGANPVGAPSSMGSPVTKGGQEPSFEPILGRAADGLSRRLDKDRWPSRPGEAQQEWEAPRTITGKLPNRAARLKALGNAVVPQVVEPIAVAIREYLEAQS